MNQYEEEMMRLNEERNAKINDIQGMIDDIFENNHLLDEKRQLNNIQVRELEQKKKAIKEEYSQKKQKIYDESKDFYSVNMSTKKLRYLLCRFMAENDETRQKWNAFVDTHFPEAQAEEEKGGVR